jgi:hypothetical protein
VTTAEDTTEQASAAGYHASRGDALAGTSPFGGLADRAMRVSWLWPTLLTLLLGIYQLGRLELWRDELWSWSFASDPVPELIKSAGKSNVAELSYDLILHYWIAAFGDSADAMRLLSVLAMAGAAACVTLAGRRLAGDRAGLLAGLGSESRVWVVVSGDEENPYGVIPQREASVLRRRYGPEPELIRHVEGLTVFLLVRT